MYFVGFFEQRQRKQQKSEREKVNIEEMTIANQWTRVSVSDDNFQAKQDRIYFKHLYLFLTTKK